MMSSRQSIWLVVLAYSGALALGAAPQKLDQQKRQLGGYGSFLPSGISSGPVTMTPSVSPAYPNSTSTKTILETSTITLSTGSSPTGYDFPYPSGEPSSYPSGSSGLQPSGGPPYSANGTSKESPVTAPTSHPSSSASSIPSGYQSSPANATSTDSAYPLGPTAESTSFASPHSIPPYTPAGPAYGAPTSFATHKSSTSSKGLPTAYSFPPGWNGQGAPTKKPQPAGEQSQGNKPSGGWFHWW